MSVVDGDAGGEDLEPDRALRPRTLDEFIGHDALRSNLRVFIASARKRGQTLDHVLFVGPPGLGKTTLARIMAREIDAGIKMTSGPILAKAGDLAAILTNLERNDVLFIDEIHRMHPMVEEVLYPAMESYELDILIGSGPAARSVRIGLNPFTLIGATTRQGLLATPFRDRFGIHQRLEYYPPEQLDMILRRAAGLLKIGIDPEGSMEIAHRSRGTPRIANRLLNRVMDFAVVDGSDMIDQAIAAKALDRLAVDGKGLDANDVRYLRLIAEKFGGGPVGVETISAAMNESRDAIEDVIEPYLLQEGYIQRTPRGRMITNAALNHLGLPVPDETRGPDLFADVPDA
ncbi:MAG: Holliday junction branch migration DNA helicase RuvB [Rhodobacteraceae bacterium]|nr:Holliday junction branch migration DNA helicase RuvB [Paracoccaceae bacterium]